MHLSRFRFNTARSGARRLLSSPQVLHAAVMGSFSGLSPRETDTPGAPRVLWRVDHNSRAEVFLHLVSPVRPDLTHLEEQAGWPTTPGWRTYEYGPFLTRLATGDQWAFRLTANPVHYIRRSADEPTKRTAHITPRHQMSWLLTHQQKAGFRIVEKPKAQRRLPEGDEWELIVHDRRDRRFAKPGHRKGIPLVTATFDGRLEVTDPDAMRRTLTQGLGKARAYGCGLMTLARAE